MFHMLLASKHLPFLTIVSFFRKKKGQIMQEHEDVHQRNGLD